MHEDYTKQPDFYIATHALYTEGVPAESDESHIEGWAYIVCTPVGYGTRERLERDGIRFGTMREMDRRAKSNAAEARRRGLIRSRAITYNGESD